MKSLETYVNESKSPWIPIKSKLPETTLKPLDDAYPEHLTPLSEPVLVLFASGDVFSAIYQGPKGESKEKWVATSNKLSNTTLSTPKYWMPIPEI